ncbi:hypothetical protein COCON_G00082180 [Conger conger]|uniref:Kaiso n=1 Tax=Conger conger TaxID=82655 RepID=A0A9Q1DQM5_CONCO|nr:transcriptional regulator Kaiso isoform X2 [Conger conger]KAJ8276466.1 hypothetical protein COCON_G00082180 [Conger conger]
MSVSLEDRGIGSVLQKKNTIERTFTSGGSGGFPVFSSEQGMSSIKLISAADTQYAGSLLKTFSDQRNNGLFCDVTIIVQSQTFKAHRNILSASSTYFHQLFSVAGQIIELNFIKAEIFEVILNYIYSAKIIRVRSDMLEELIKSGKILGVKFIASLGRPLSHVKGLPNLSEDQAEGKSSQNSTANAPEKSDLISQELGSGAMPIITEAFSLSAEEFKGDCYKDGGSDNDVLFVSKQEPKKARQLNSTKAVCKPSAVINVDESSAEDTSSGEEEAVIPETSSAAVKEVSSMEKKDQKPMTEKVEEGKSSKLNSSSQAQPDSTSSSSHMEQECPDTSTSMPHSPAGSSSGDSLCSQPLPPQTDGSPKEPCNISLSKDNHEVIGVQKKQITTVLETSADRPGEFKIKLCDIGPAHSPESIMFEKDSEMDLVSSGSRDSDDSGDDTYDIVPMKNSPRVGDSKTKRERKSLSAPNSPGSPPSGVGGKKKAKVGMDDHYELIMDGKTFYVCIVCKRPYVCLTSLRRHFNVHSWEKKYPCHYCDKVFPLAEYRTKHEIQHTGERRYQCLLCGDFFMNYQVLSSHCKQVHNQDPSGRKEKEYTDNNLYRLLPCKTLEIKSYSCVPEGKIPMINEEGIVYHVDPREGLTAGSESPSTIHGRMMNWDDIFVESGSQTRVNPAEDTPEFEFVIPETY